MNTVEHKNVHIYEQVLYYWNNDCWNSVYNSSQLIDLLHRFPSEFKNDLFLVAVSHHHKRFNQIDFDKSLKIYTGLMAQNHSYAINNLAYMYENGQGVVVDIKKAIKLYERAVDLNNSTAMHNLALLYKHGQGVEKNVCRALDLYLQGKYMNKAQKIVDDCLDLKDKMNLLKICLKHDFYPEHSWVYVVVLRERWLTDIVNGVYLHQKHPLYNRHMDALINKYM